MEWLQEDSGASRNPIDLLEELVRANDWTFERPTETELMVEVEGRWCGYYLLFIWRGEVGAVSFSCHFDQKVPSHSWPAIYQLLGRVNEALWLGHFDLAAEDSLLLFRHTIPLRGAPGASVEQLEDLVDAAVVECERFYPALQMVVWGGQTVGDASPEARAHEMSTEISVATTDFMGEPITFIDCPGSVDFRHDGQAALALCDAAIVVAEAQAEKLPALQMVMRDVIWWLVCPIKIKRRWLCL